jgi:uncharacterized protein YndB with AHSA1/START domain
MTTKPSSPAPDLALDGTVDRFDDRVVLRFERRLHHPRERVWTAITDPDALRTWFASSEPDAVSERVVEDGRQVLRFDDASGHRQRFVILEEQPPSVFAHTWADHDANVVRWELHPDDDGCRLVLTHTIPKAELGADDIEKALPGWHALLELLGDALDGEPREWTMARWEELRAQYAARAQ